MHRRIVWSKGKFKLVKICCCYSLEQGFQHTLKKIISQFKKHKENKQKMCNKDYHSKATVNLQCTSVSKIILFKSFKGSEIMNYTPKGQHLEYSGTIRH